MRMDTHSPLDIQRILKFRNIAVVGMSKNEEKPAHFVPKYLIDHGYNVIPVNPTVNEILGSHIRLSLEYMKMLILLISLEGQRMCLL